MSARFGDLVLAVPHRHTHASALVTLTGSEAVALTPCLGGSCNSHASKCTVMAIVTSLRRTWAWVVGVMVARMRRIHFSC
eukprot:365734-Chlamydomonas_euryale.AAC.19